jgi:DNA adenine methylase
MTLLPPFPYFGGKQTLAAQIVSHFPEHSRYVEPFAGSLAVLLAKAPEPYEVVNDLDGRLVGFWRTLRDRGEELERACALTPHSRHEYMSAKREGPSDDPIEDARRLWVLYTQSISGAYEGAGWRAPGPTRKSPGQHFSRFHERFHGLADRLRHVSIENVPYASILSRYAHDAECLLYVDPPYLAETRSTAKEYVHDMSSPAEHRELLSLLLAHEGPVVLSGYASPLYDEMLEGWTQIPISAMTQVGGERTEILYVNRTPPPVLFGGEFLLEEVD